jgi:hypothetical protein
VQRLDRRRCTLSATSMIWRRALVVWLVVIAAETVHGILRQLFLAPIVGDLAARQIGVVVGSFIIFIIAFVSVRWLNARTLREQLGVGALWVVLTVVFELALGTLLGLTRERMLADYDLTAGGFMAFGLLFLLLSPVLAARARP